MSLGLKGLITKFIFLLKLYNCRRTAINMYWLLYIVSVNKL